MTGTPRVRDPGEGWVADVAVVGGCGHVGLPLALKLADEGQRVLAVDTDRVRVLKVNSGEMPFREDGAGAVLDRVQAANMLGATSNLHKVREATSVILVTGTQDDSVIPFLRSGQLVVLRSTASAGDFEAFEKRLAGLDVDLAFCPERIAEGHALAELENLPQIIAANTWRALTRARNLFSFAQTVSFMSPEEAELAKLFTNTWRYIQFAAVNEFWAIAARRGLDFERIRRGLMFGYPRAIGMPAAGFAGGPCLPKDARLLGGIMASAALHANESMPEILAAQLAEEHDLPNLTIGILGMTFKPGSDDERGSLSHALRAALERHGARRVLCTDPYLPDLPLLDEVLAAADLLIVATAHPEYEQIENAIRICP